MQNNSGMYYDQLLSLLTDEEKDTLRKNFEIAQIQENECKIGFISPNKIVQRMKQDKNLSLNNQIIS